MTFLLEHTIPVSDPEMMEVCGCNAFARDSGELFLGRRQACWYGCMCGLFAIFEPLASEQERSHPSDMPCATSITRRYLPPNASPPTLTTVQPSCGLAALTPASAGSEVGAWYLTVLNLSPPTVLGLSPFFNSHRPPALPPSLPPSASPVGTVGECE